MRKLFLAFFLCSISFAGFAQTTSYCVPESMNGNSAYINAVQLGTLNSVTGQNTWPYYTSYVSAPAANQTTDLAQGSQERIIINLSGGYHVERFNQAYVWIDYNQDSDFDDAGELVGSGYHQYDGDVILTFTVPLTATTGTTRMRVRNTQDYGDDVNACNMLWDTETEDYAVTVVAPTACAGTPTLGNAVTSNAGPLCSGMSFDLSVTPYSVFASGISYQWQVSTAGAAGPFIAIAGQTYTTATITGQTQSSWYRLAATCVNSRLIGVSSPVNVTQQLNIAACYCMPENRGDNTWDFIHSVQLGTINNVSGKNTTVYTSYVSNPAPNLTTSMIQGSQQTITIYGVVDRYATPIKTWIDFNQDGDFNDDGEQVAFGDISYYSSASFTASFTVPLTAVLGPTRMRVHSAQANGSIDPCAATRSGETEDYLVIIVTLCSVQPVTTTIAANGPTAFCKGNSVVLTASGADAYL